VSPSTVTQLKERSAPSAISAWSASCAIGASVKTKASIVAMSGAIMPEPLAMPLMTTSQSPIITLRVAYFGKVSVVMMARAAASQASGSARAAES